MLTFLHKARDACKALSLLGLLALAHCTHVDMTDGEGKTQRYFGFVSIKSDNTNAGLLASRIASTGITIDGGVTLGHRAVERILLDLERHSNAAEAPCQIVIIVRTAHEAEHARLILEPLKGKNICLTSLQDDA